jgi:hypothetical protein
VAIVVSHADDLPDPGAHERDSYESQSDERAIATLPLLVVQDFLQSVAAGNLEDDGDEGEKTSCSEVVAEGVDGAAVDEEAFGREEGGDLDMSTGRFFFFSVS